MYSKTVHNTGWYEVMVDHITDTLIPFPLPQSYIPAISPKYNIKYVSVAPSYFECDMHGTLTSLVIVAGQTSPLDLPGNYGRIQAQIQDDSRDMLNKAIQNWGKSVGCSHDFRPYQGLFESYEYCSKCDVKR
jgi:hypothetical protein